MSYRDARARVLACAEADDDVAAGALWIAAEECGDVDPEPWLVGLDELGDELGARCGTSATAQTASTSIPVIAGLLADRVRLRGVDGGHPRAHYLHTVLARGAGIPIACSAIWMAVGRRAGLPVEGVGLPGHFVVRLGGTLVDAYAGGEPLDLDGVRRLVGRALGDESPEIRAEWLQPVGTREVLARMSRNLRACHVSRGDWRKALLAADRCVQLQPGSAVERRERGTLLVRLGATSQGLVDLRAYLDSAAEVADREAVEKVVAQARAAAN